MAEKILGTAGKGRSRGILSTEYSHEIRGEMVRTMSLPHDVRRTFCSEAPGDADIPGASARRVSSGAPQPEYTGTSPGAVHAQDIRLSDITRMPTSADVIIGGDPANI